MSSLNFENCVLMYSLTVVIVPDKQSIHLKQLNVVSTKRESISECPDYALHTRAQSYVQLRLTVARNILSTLLAAFSNTLSGA